MDTRSVSEEIKHLRKYAAGNHAQNDHSDEDEIVRAFDPDRLFCVISDHILRRSARSDFLLIKLSVDKNKNTEYKNQI